MRLNISLAALAALTVVSTPAAAQQATASAQAEAHGTVLQRLTLTKQTDLDFGTVVATAAAGGVVIDPDTGNRTVSGGVTGVPSFPGGRAVFTGLGDPNQNVTVGLSNVPTVLVSTTNPLDTVAVNSITMDNGNATSRSTGSGGVFQVGVGGDFGIAANQPNGFYKANFDLTADYQ